MTNFVGGQTHHNAYGKQSDHHSSSSVYKSKCHFSCENCPFKEGVTTGTVSAAEWRRREKGVYSLQYVGMTS